MFITETRMAPWPAALAGRLEKVTMASELLRGNPLGDPHERPLSVYLPPDYPDETRRFPALYLLPGYGGSVASWTRRPVFGQPVLEMIDEAFATGRAPQAVVVSVDGWTRYGGSQYIDSDGTGRYHSYLCDEIVSHVDDRYRTIADRDYRAVLGMSSGGFGALVACMLRPDVFSGCASHAGDAFYEIAYQPRLPEIVRALRSWDGDIVAWWADFQARWPDVRPAERLLQSRYAGQLQSMRGVWIDAGSEDEFFLDLGAQALDRALRANGMANDALHFEIVPGADHDAIGRRQIQSVCWLAKRLSAA